MSLWVVYGHAPLSYTDWYKRFAQLGNPIGSVIATSPSQEYADRTGVLLRRLTPDEESAYRLTGRIDLKGGP